MPTWTVAAVIPAFNEESRIAATVAETLAYVDEVVVIDDGSGDATAERARAAGARVIRRPESSGYVASLLRGFASVETNIVVTLDADGEMPLERIPDLVAPVANGTAGMVQGSRRQVPRPSERFLTWVASFGGPVGDSGTGFRALQTDLAKTLRLEGACICGIFALEVLQRGETILDLPIEPRTIAKPRRIAWFHLLQVVPILRLLIRSRIRRSDP